MSASTIIILILLGLVLILFSLWRRATSRHADVAFAKASQSSKYGKMTEQFMPFLKDYPYDPQNFRFLGTPIDGIQFEEDKIIFIEFKTNSSQLSPRQKQVAQNVWQKRVEFEEHRIE
ncbi:MAG: Holliday junction resolvase-like protein [Candidatus Berkelbacteria bacterium]|nr:Holliday junction resolvase-like protein [Candidatus Berkelbacteria bacterium]